MSSSCLRESSPVRRHQEPGAGSPDHAALLLLAMGFQTPQQHPAATSPANSKSALPKLRRLLVTAAQSPATCCLVRPAACRRTPSQPSAVKVNPSNLVDAVRDVGETLAYQFHVLFIHVDT